MEQFVTYIQSAIEETQKREQELISSECKDEATLQKIRSNVYGICLTVFQVTSKAKSGEELREEYLGKLSNIVSSWKTSYEKAKEHNDVEKIVIEETKLEVYHEVIKAFDEWREKDAGSRSN